MPVHVAGPRVLSSVKFKHLVKKTNTERGSNISLNLTPFVDMMTILVAFLLMVFSSSNVLLQDQKGLELPLAESRNVLQDEIPIIQVSKTEIDFKGAQVTLIEQVLKDDSPTAVIEDLKEKLHVAHDQISRKINEQLQGGSVDHGYSNELLESCASAKQGKRAKPGKYCPDGLAILQADKEVDVRVINKIVNTAKLAGFDNLLFAIKNK
jgi:biopolymer transport protein ExbD